MRSSNVIQKIIAASVLYGLLVLQNGQGQAARLVEPDAACNPTVQALINSTPAGGTVYLQACTNTESLVIAKDLTLIGDASGNTTLQAPPNQRVITLNGVYLLKLENLTLTGGAPPSPSGGGAISANDGSLQITNSTIRNNSATYGGGIFEGSATGSVIVTGSRIENNTAAIHGGGIFSNGSLTLSNTEFISNTAGYNGGGVTVITGNTSIQGGIFSHNVATNINGGAVNVNNGLTVSDAQFVSNSAGDSGGAITQWNPGKTVCITHSTFNGNHAKKQGGGVFVNSAVTFDHDTFNANVVDSGGTDNTYGGGISAGNTGRLRLEIGTSTVIVLDSTFTNNIAHCTGCIASHGGGIYSDGDPGRVGAVTTTIERSAFQGNQAWSGGGVLANYHKLIIDSSTFGSNSGGYGGGIEAYILQGESLTFLNNHVVNGGAGLYAYDLTLSRSRFIGNIGGNDGGSAIDIGNKASLTNLLLVNNTSTGDGAIGMNARTTGVFRNLTITRDSPATSIAVKIASTSTITMENTIITNHYTGVDLFGTLIENHNLYYQNISANVKPELFSIHISGGNILVVDPKFVDPPYNDYHLQAGSPAIPGGIYIPGVDVDLDYRPRVPGRSAMGAYNFGYYGFLPAVLR